MRLYAFIHHMLSYVIMHYAYRKFSFFCWKRISKRNTVHGATSRDQPSKSFRERKRLVLQKLSKRPPPNACDSAFLVRRQTASLEAGDRCVVGKPGTPFLEYFSSMFLFIPPLFVKTYFPSLQLLRTSWRN